MTVLAIDIETYSSNDLLKGGVYKYVEAPDFEVLMMAISEDDAPPVLYDLTNHDPEQDELLGYYIAALTNPTVLKTAYNANFERTCLAKHFGMELPPEQWECTAVKAAMAGLPHGLDAVAKALGIEQQKDASGKALIRYFSLPCKPTKTNGQRTRNHPHHDPEKWERYKAYCVQDVVVESAIRRKIDFFMIPEQERQLWCLDQRINDTGVLVDRPFVEQAIRMDATHREKLLQEAVKLTGLENPNSATQLREWLGQEMGEEVATLRKADIPELLKKSDCQIVDRVLGIRQELAKTSVKKYEAMKAAVCEDGRVRGLLQYYGANRTGRWAGRLVQVQNLPQNHLGDLDLARQLVREGALHDVDAFFGNVPDTLSQLIRTAFVAPDGHRFIVADFSAIEARVIAWLAGEQWRLNVFATHGKIYEASAAQMFKVPIESIHKGSDLRQKGKVAELALGYQGGAGALVQMGAIRMGIPEDELPKLVAMWRQANKNIVGYWYEVEAAAIECVESGQSQMLKHGVRFFVHKNVLFIELPSGRRLSYLRPKLVPGKFDKMALTYQGVDQVKKQWCTLDTYGGKLVENIVQAVARDCLAHAMLKLDAAGYRIVMHVHDEVVLEMPDSAGSLEEVNAIMGVGAPWAKGLPLRADSYETRYYRKD